MGLLATIGWIGTKVPMIGGQIRKHSPRLSGMRIVTPPRTEPIEVGQATIYGTCSFKPDGDWVVMKQVGKDFWPGGSVEFHHTDPDWSAKLWVDPKNSEPIKVILARIERPIRYFIEYFWKHANATNHAPLSMDFIPQGMVIVHQVEYGRRPAS